jgi:hypothetical protein
VCAGRHSTSKLAYSQTGHQANCAPLSRRTLWRRFARRGAAPRAAALRTASAAARTPPGAGRWWRASWPRSV